MDQGRDTATGPADDRAPDGTPGVSPELAAHPDRLRWNAKYESASAKSPFAPHPLAVRALAALAEAGARAPAGPVLDLACGTSGSALLAAEAGRRVIAVDISEVALGRLYQETVRRGLDELITPVQADLGAWTPDPAGYALVLCTGFWDRAVYLRAARAVLPGGLLAWEAFTTEARRVRDGLPAEWCLDQGEPASLLPDGFTVLDQEDLPDGQKRRLLARGPAAVS